MNLPSGKCHNFNLSQLFTCTFDTSVLSRCIFGALYCIDYFKAASGARPLRNRRSGNASIFVIYLGCRDQGHVTVRGSHVIAFIQQSFLKIVAPINIQRRCRKPGDGDRVDIGRRPRARTCSSIQSRPGAFNHKSSSMIRECVSCAGINIPAQPLPLMHPLRLRPFQRRMAFLRPGKPTFYVPPRCYLRSACRSQNIKRLYVFPLR